MNILEARRRTLGGRILKKTVTGNPAVAQGSLARRGPGITMQGWTEQDGTPTPEAPVPIVSAGTQNQDTGKWEYEITITNAQTDPDKNQTVTLTADRPLTKWDRLEKRDGVWGWVYKSGKKVIDGTETYISGGDRYISEKSSNAYINNNDMVNGILGFKNGYCNRLTYVNIVWAAVDSIGFCYNSKQIHMRISNDSLGTTSESTPQEVISAMKNYMSQQYNDGNPFVFWYETAEETFVPLSESEQEQMNNLHTYRPTTVLSNQQDCEMALTYKTRKSMEVTA